MTKIEIERRFLEIQDNMIKVMLNVDALLKNQQELTLILSKLCDRVFTGNSSGVRSTVCDELKRRQGIEP